MNMNELNGHNNFQYVDFESFTLNSSSEREKLRFPLKDITKYISDENSSPTEKSKYKSSKSKFINTENFANKVKLIKCFR